MNDPARLPAYVFEGFRLDTQRRVLFGVDGQPITLTPRLFDALLYFVERAGKLLTKEQLLEAIWPNVIVEEHNLNKTVSELRRVLGEKPGEHKFFVTKPGHGYRFVAPVSPEPAADARSAARQPDSGPAVTVRQPSSAARRRWRIAALSTGALAIVLAVLGLFRPATDPVLRVTPWASEERQGRFWPVWSPDGTEIAWTALRTAAEPADLYIRALNEPIPRSITRRPGTLSWITQWTSDGKIFFFEREGLYSITPAGTPFLEVPMDYPALGVFPPTRTVHLTRDGSTLAMLAAGDDDVAVLTATPPNAMPRKYEPAPFAASGYQSVPFLRFSPDGSQILFVWYASGRGEEAWLLPFPPDTDNPPRRVLENLPLAQGLAEFSWFPDNRHIAISTGREWEKRALYVADTQSGKYRLLVDELTGQEEAPVVSPDGTKLLFTDLTSDFDIVTLDLETREVTDTIATGRDESMPSWASKANALVYLTNRSGSWEIWLRQPPQPDGPVITQSHFDSETQYLIAPTLSPDGARVIFWRAEAQRPGWRLWMSAVAGARPDLLTNDEQLDESAGSWSPDGTWFAYFANSRDGGPRMLKKVATTGRATPETLLEGLSVTGIPAPIWSPDGNWILVPNDGMMLVSADGKTPPRRLGIENSVCMFADDEFLYCVREYVSPVEQHPLQKLDLYGNVKEELLVFPHAVTPNSPFTPGLSFSPTQDRTSVTYSVAKGRSNLFLLEGLDTVQLP